MLTKKIQDESNFTTESVGLAIGLPWAEIALVHESENGWSAIYTCLHNGRRIILKTLKPRYKDSKLHQELLKKEYSVGRTMAHRGIVSTLGFENVPGVGDCILMEFVDGTTLDEFVAHRSGIGKKVLLSLMKQICDAVSYIHSRQTVHCDLKPSNILITRQGNFVKLIDFGLCRGMGYDLLDIPGGTQGFTAPENLLPDSKASIATDIYSLGKILELLDSKRQLKGLNRLCLSADPNSRPKSADDVFDLICRRYNQRKRATLIGAVVGAVLLTCLLVWISLSSRKEDAMPSENSIARTEAKSDSTKEADTKRVLMVTEPMKADEAAHVITGMKTDTDINGTDERLGSETEIGDFDKRLAVKLNEVMERRFSDHLALIDTMNTVRSNELQLVGHWRWLAKTDMRKWLEQELYPDFPRIEASMKIVEREVNDYVKDNDRAGLQWEHRVEAAKRNPAMGAASSKYAYYNELDELVVRKLGEDGVWREEKIQVPINRLDPMETLRIKGEYMKKALED